MTLSPDGIEALARRAAEGAGFSPAMAKEAAAATRWLREHGLEACEPLVALLFRHDDNGHPQGGPQSRSGDWRGAEGWLCPIACGAGLVAPGSAAFPAEGLTLRRVALPVFLLPFAARLARSAGRPVALDWSGGRALSDGDTIMFDTPPLMSDVTLRADTGEFRPLARRPRRAVAEPDQMILAALRIYAARADAADAMHPGRAVPSKQDQKGPR